MKSKTILASWIIFWGVAALLIPVVLMQFVPSLSQTWLLSSSLACLVIACANISEFIPANE
ncbi:hypothetical protein [Undibacterium oligocarboniphilum]|uniref:Uncharacterized protein n=1 Tax=Undibacterium oligocarboniphilum TaxID=666702 RepID=A0A850QRE9_9BURK|nr:hypothetical protein [Undibacterium oligocarboniphilum]MBC3871744.1 hypothetical protein [Undibacterium oligocarboniphilum]NVO79380.1 hypothetical protein [Undibacterium oligocarboniphilum]